MFPVLQPKLEAESVFLPQAIPTAAVRRVVENLRKNQSFKDFLYKGAATNPTNLRDQADESEENLVD